MGHGVDACVVLSGEASNGMVVLNTDQEGTMLDDDLQYFGIQMFSTLRFLVETWQLPNFRGQDHKE